jgi:hypothetical protein
MWFILLSQPNIMKLVHKSNANGTGLSGKNL